jgi:hypothetical protein
MNNNRQLNSQSSQFTSDTSITLNSSCALLVEKADGTDVFKVNTLTDAITIRGDLTGVAGTILTGGIASGDDITLRSTTHATKGSVIFDETTDAVSSLTGAVIIAGGVGINKKLFVNSQIRGGSSAIGSTDACSITALGQIIITNTNNASSSTSGSLKSEGGISCEKDMWVGIDLNVDGVIMVDSTKVVGSRQSAVADATDAATAISQLNLLLTRCRNHGLIAP